MVQTKDFFSPDAFKKRMDEYTEVIKKSTPQQKQIKEKRISRFLKQNNIDLTKIRQLFQTMSNDVTHLVELFMLCKKIFVYETQNITDNTTRQHYQRIYSFLEEIKIQDLWWKYQKAITNKIHYREKLEQTLHPYHQEIEQFIIFTLEGTIALSDKKTEEEEEPKDNTGENKVSVDELIE